MSNPGRREQNKERTRAAIVVAAVQLMQINGYSGTTTTAIAEAAGVAPATLFNYFPTKASILFADAQLWRPPPDPGRRESAAASLIHLIGAMLDRPEWIRGVDDPLTAARFEIVRREPELQAIQAAQALAQAPVFAETLRRLHPDLDREQSLVLAGSAIGAIITVVNTEQVDNLRATVMRAATLALGQTSRQGRR